MRKIFVLWLGTALLLGMFTGMGAGTVGCEIAPTGLFGGGNFGGGNGTIENPYIIEDVWDLQNMSANLSAHYALGNDIDASATANWNNDSGVLEGFIPVGPGPWDVPANHFTGTLNGQNHTITGLYINRTDEWYVGMFGYIGIGGKVTNLTIVNSSIGGQYVVGGLAGAIEATSVSNINISGNASGFGNWVGGMIGWSWNGTITESHAYGVVKGTEIIGGLVGLNEEGNIDRSSYSGSVSSIWNWTGGLVGLNWMGNVSKSSTDAVVNGNKCVGGLVGYNEYGAISLSHAEGNVSGTGWYVGGLVGSNIDGTIQQSYATGNVKGDFCVGGLAGNSTYYVIDCFATGKVDGVSDIGGVIGYMDGGTITDSYATGSVNGSGRIGGLIGSIDNGGYVSNTHSTGDINSTADRVGGLIGWNRYGLIIDSHSTGNVSGNQMVGGLIGMTESGSINNTYATGNVKGEWMYLGGLIGWNRFGSLTYSHAHGNVNGLYSVGGLVGKSEGLIQNSYSTGIVNGDSWVGGFVGGNNYVINKSFATGKVMARGAVGGFVGDNVGIINFSYSKGQVNGNNAVGGFVGQNLGLITKSFATSDVIGRDNEVGGFVGGNSVQIYNSYAWGNVTRLSSLNDTFGGFTGNNSQAKIINCYSVGKVIDANASNPTSNGFAGHVTIGGSYEMSGNFWDIQTSQQSTTAGNATGKTTSLMKNKSTFTSVNWDFNNIWWMAENITYPLLAWEETESPRADAGPNRFVNPGENVTFDGSGSTDDYGIASYNWTFQYGAENVSMNDQSPQFQFNQTGVFIVTLKVTDFSGKWDTDNMTVTVIDLTDPVANAGPDQTVDEGSVVTFNGSVSTDNVGITNYTWEFMDSDMIVLYGIEPTYLFSNPGTFIVTLTVRDAANRTDSDNMAVIVRDITPPVARAGIDQNATMGVPVHLNGSASTDNVGITNYTWTLVHNNTDVLLYGMTQTFTFWTVGDYSVTLMIRDAAGNLGIDTMVVTVNPLQEPDLPGTTFIIIGPVLDIYGNPISGAMVTVIFNGTNYTGITNSTGYTKIEMPMDAIGQQITVVIFKDGYDATNYSTTLTHDGTVANPPPPLVKPETDDVDNFPWFVLIIIIIIATIIAISWKWKKNNRINHD